MEISNKKLIYIIIYFLICFISEIFYSNYLYTKSLYFQNGIQNFIKSINFQTIFSKITKTGKDWFFIYISLFIGLIFSIKHAYIIFLNVFFVSYIKELLKMIYHHKRPFWENSNINIGCSTDFGHPSGHSICSTTGYLTLYYFISKRKYFKKNIIFRFLIFFLFLIYIFLILISRLNDGVHSLDQVLFGFTLGCGFYILFFFVFEIDNLKLNQVIEFLNLFIVILFNILSLLLPIGIYYIMKKINNNFPYQPPDECLKKESYLPQFSKLYEKSLISSMKVSLISGCLFSLLYVKYFMKIINIDDENKLISWDHHNIYQRIGTFLFILILGYPGYYIYHINFFNKTDKLYVILLFKQILPLEISAFFMFGFGIYISIKMVDILKKNQSLNESELYLTSNLDI